MIKTATLAGALLDYWTARAEGVPTEQLEIRQVQRSDQHHVVHTAPPIPGWMGRPSRVMNYQGDPMLWAPLIETYGLTVEQYPPAWWANEPDSTAVMGATPQEAICRAVVRAAFGDEVEDVPA